MTFRAALLPLLALPLALAAVSVRAAESYDNCAYMIVSLPVTITQQGVWCLQDDLSTALASGAAVSVEANNVTIDCNGFKIGGLPAGDGTQTYGISIPQNSSTTVRGCNVRGFYIGLRANGGEGHRFEDNLVVGSTWIGILATGPGTIVRGNVVTDTGGSTVTNSTTTGVFVSGGASVVDNTVAAVNGIADGTVYGIRASANAGGSILGNRVSALVPYDVGAQGYGIASTAGRVVIEGNHLVGLGLNDTVGVWCSNSSGTSVRNTVVGFSSGTVGCTASGDVYNAN